MSAHWELGPDETLLWQVEIDKDFVASDRRKVERNNRIGYFLMPVIVLLCFGFALWRNQTEYSRLTLFTMAILFVPSAIYGVFIYHKKLKSGAYGNPYLDDVTGYAMTNRRFFYLDNLGGIVEQFDDIGDYQVNEYRRLRRYFHNYEHGIALGKAGQRFNPDIAIWGLTDYPTAENDIRKALERIKA